MITTTDENSLTACKEKCHEFDTCVAFAYESPKDPNNANCHTYEGGPYTKGNDRKHTTCYIRNMDILPDMKHGTLTSFQYRISDFQYIKFQILI